LITGLHAGNLEPYTHHIFSPTLKGLLYDVVTI